MNTSFEKETRWWPFLVLTGLSLAVELFLVASAGDEGSRQRLILKTYGVVGAWAALSLLWLVGFSRMRWKIRLAVVAGIALLTGLVASTVRFEGVSGDLIPILVWRWSTPATTTAANSASADTLVVKGSYPQFLGPNRDATVSGISLAKNWNETPPQLLWRQPIGESWSGFAVSGNRAVTQEQEGEEERIRCYNLLSGELLWDAKNTARYDSSLGGVGPRATPSIDNDRVYSLGGTGHFACLSLESGEILFELNILDENSLKVPDWGISRSPLVFENLVILSPGGENGNSLAAYDKLSGELMWKSGDRKGSYSSPVIRNVNGQPQILNFHRSGIAGHDIADGATLWEFPWTRSTGTPRVAVPVQFSENRFVISSGYGSGATAFEVNQEANNYSTTELWYSLHLKAKFNNFVFRDGYLYGLDDGALTCINIETGRRAWKKGRYGHGQLLLGDDWLLLAAENGEVLLIDPTPDEPRILSRFQALEGKCWNPPAIVGPYLLLRNHLEAACYRLPLEP